MKYAVFVTLLGFFVFAHGSKCAPNFTDNICELMCQRKGPYGGEYISPTSPFENIFQWNFLQYEYPTKAAEEAAIAKGEYIVENVMALGVDIWKDRLFISTPPWKTGVPASLGTVDLALVGKSRQGPTLRAYPDMEFYTTVNNTDCSKILSVYRVYIDECDRVWLFDSGYIFGTTTQCPPKIIVFDLTTNQQILKYYIPDAQVGVQAVFVNIIVDIPNGQCNDAYAYAPDVVNHVLVVYSLKKNISWMATHQYMYPSPFACNYDFHNEIFFEWFDGIFGLAVGLPDEYGERLFYFNPLSGFDVFSVPISILQNETIWTEGTNVAAEFKHIGYKGKRSQSTTCGIDRDGVLFFSLVQQDAIGCWDTNKPLLSYNMHQVDQNWEILPFPIDVKVDRAVKQGVWVVINNSPSYIYGTTDLSQVNYRILRADTKSIVKNTACDPTKSWDKK